jgi:regulator of protease activity HflC (stomatin/prohibitin superfamily)
MNFFSKSRKVGERLTPAVRNWGLFTIVGENYAVMVHRFQKFNRQLQPGLNIMIPFIDTVAYVHDLREEVLEITSQVAVTKDNVALNIDGVLYIKINDPYKASYGVEDYAFAVSQLAQTTMRSEIGKMTLDKLFEERETLNADIVKAVEKESEDWGIDALRYEIKDIVPPSNISNAMILQAEAERKKRASILASEGEQISNVNIAEAEKISLILKAEGEAEGLIVQAKA